MKKRLVILGVGGQGKVCGEIAVLNGYQSICYLDDDSSKGSIVSGKTEDFTHYLRDYDFFVAFGNNELRKRFLTRIEEAGGSIATLIHPNCTISADSSIGKGTVVMAGAVINPGTVVGKGTIINTCASLDHDNTIEDYAHIGVGTHLAGTVHVKECAFIGAGVTIINNLTVCGGCIIGAGAVVIRNIVEKGTYVGVPTRRIK